jgi:hypothetical protein
MLLQDASACLYMVRPGSKTSASDVWLGTPQKRQTNFSRCVRWWFFGLPSLVLQLAFLSSRELKNSQSKDSQTRPVAKRALTYKKYVLSGIFGLRLAGFKRSPG